MYIWKAVTAISGSAKYGAKVSDTVIIYLNAVDWEAGDAQDWMEAEMNKADTNVKANVFAIVNDDDEIELLVIGTEDNEIRAAEKSAQLSGLFLHKFSKVVF